jgi:hypothetical protein
MGDIRQGGGGDAAGAGGACGTVNVELMDSICHEVNSALAAIALCVWQVELTATTSGHLSTRAKGSASLPTLRFHPSSSDMSSARTPLLQGPGSSAEPAHVWSSNGCAGAIRWLEHAISKEFSTPVLAA